MLNFLIIDGSYYCFFRYFAVVQWFKLAKPGEPLTTPADNPAFLEKYEKMFKERLEIFIKKLEIDNPIIIVGRDCPRRDIWRNEIFPKYKAHRGYNTGLHGGLISRTWDQDEELFREAGAQLILQHPRLEADDCIAITTKYILKTYKEAKIWIVTSDTDYLQLAGERVKLYNLKHKDLTEGRTCFKDPKKDLFCKIVAGDKSDGIPSVFSRCGIKTAAKYFDNREKFKERLEKDGAQALYARNTELIDFDAIPETLVKEFHRMYGLPS